MRKPEHNIGGDRQVREQRPLLRDVTDTPFLRRDVDARAGDKLSVDLDRA